MILTDKEKSSVRELLLKYYDSLDEDCSIALLIGTAKNMSEQRNAEKSNAAAAGFVREILAANESGKIIYFPTVFYREAE